MHDLHSMIQWICEFLGWKWYRFLLILLSLYVTTNCVLPHYWSVAFIYSSADRKNLTVLCRPCPLTWINLLFTYRTCPLKSTCSNTWWSGLIFQCGCVVICRPEAVAILYVASNDLCLCHVVMRVVFDVNVHVLFHKLIVSVFSHLNDWSWSWTIATCWFR